MTNQQLLQKLFAFQFILLIGLALVSPSLGQIPSDIDPQTRSKMDQYSSRVMKRYGIPGATFAIIKDGKVIHRSNLGFAELNHQVPVSEKTIFRLFSTTKLFTATAIFQLVEHGKISIDDKIGKHLSDLPDSWKAVTIANLLTHSSGLPELVDHSINIDEKSLAKRTYLQKFRFTPGHRFSYTQTNYWLLKRIIEKQSGQLYEDFVITNQFGSNKNQLLFSSNSNQIVTNRATNYNTDNSQNLFQSVTYHNPPYAHSGNGLNLSLSRFIEWSRRFNSGKILNQRTKSAMWKKFSFQSNDRFAMGWGIYRLGDNESFGFTGGGCTGFRVFPKQNLSIIWLSNGYRGSSDTNTTINYLAGLVEKSLLDKGLHEQERILAAIDKGDIKAVQKIAQSLIKNNPEINIERPLLSAAYRQIKNSEIQKAISLFQLNLKLNPKSWNAHDSLAEGYYLTGETMKAIEHYQKSIKLNPSNTNGIKMLKKISTNQKK